MCDFASQNKRLKSLMKLFFDGSFDAFLAMCNV